MSTADKIKIVVDFDNANTQLRDSDGRVFTGIPATGIPSLTRTNILNKIREKYESVFGAGEVTVVAGSVGHGLGGGDFSLVITADRAPGGEFGDAGVTGGPGFVYWGQFVFRVFDAAQVANYVGETAAHEVAHRLGVAHNANTVFSKLMARGNLVSQSEREANGRAFRSAETKQVLSNAPKRPLPAPAAKKMTPKRRPGPGSGGRKPEIRYRRGRSTTSSKDDQLWSARCYYTGDRNDLEIGFLNIDSEFIYLSDVKSSTGAPEMLMWTDGQSGSGAILALRSGSSVWDYITHGTGISYSQPSPNKEGRYLQAFVYFDLDLDGAVDHTVTLDAFGELTTGGFVDDPGAPVPILPWPAMLATMMLLSALGILCLRSMGPSEGSM